jgi:SAM-dependent methyltransferase
MSRPETTRALYDTQAGRWARTEPRSLSDFTARPRVLELCEPVAGRRVLDLGCGEGYVSRLLRRRGGQVTGIDLSAGMIEEARREERREPLGIAYEVADACTLTLEPGAWDLVVAVFLFNYLTLAQTREVLRAIRRGLAPGGRLVFAVPHPSFAFLGTRARPFYFDAGGAGYFSGRDRACPGRIWRRDGTPLAVEMVHKTLEDYFRGLEEAGFTRLPRLRELAVTPELLGLDPEFFGPVADLPLHLALEVTS